MNGPEHYREAEKIIAGLDAGIDHAVRTKASVDSVVVALQHSVALAQVHATLALAAATALPYASDDAADTTGGQWDAQTRAWMEAIS